MLAFQAVAGPIGLIQIAIVAEAIVAKESFVNLFNQQVITGWLAIDGEPDEIGATSSYAGPPVKLISQRLGQHPAVARFKDNVSDAHAVPFLILPKWTFQPPLRSGMRTKSNNFAPPVWGSTKIKAESPRTGSAAFVRAWRTNGGCSD